MTVNPAVAVLVALLGCVALVVVLRAGARRRRRRTGAGPAAAAVPVVALNLEVSESGAGARFGRYVLIERIGAGGMAEIFTAAGLQPSGTPLRLVLKRLPESQVNDATAVAQLEEEAAIARTVEHPNVVRTLDVGRANGQPYMAQEYLLGRDVGRLTRRMVEGKEAPLSVSAICYLAHEVLRALEHVHDCADQNGPLEIVHRDISPENIFITDAGEVKLIDFGIAKRKRNGVLQPDVGEVKGNVDFMAPEQAQGLAVDRRADLFSVGMVMYFCAARAPLYRGKSFEQRLVKAALGPGKCESEFVAGLPAPLPEIIAQALHTAPDKRPRTARDMRRALAPHIAGGAAELSDVVRRLFGDELTTEQTRFAAAFRPIRVPESAIQMAGRGAARRRATRGVPARTH